MNILIEKIKAKQEEIHQWLISYEGSKELPLYSSVDIRQAGFKTAVVDTNLFPAGFNNLCEHGIEDSIKFLREAVLKRVPTCKNILIIAEEHTRNTWYLENIRILQYITEQAGFNVKIATFLSVQPSFCENAKYVELETATGLPVKIYCFKRILEDYKAGKEHFCLIIMNNDLSTGIPEVLKNSKEPIYPSIAAGWHSRLKSHHFKHTNDLIQEFAKIIDIDPWIFSCLYKVEAGININNDEDRQRLTKSAQILFEEIEQKYKEHQIQEKPYIILKADSGTYGMGVLPIEDPEEILSLNRKNRNRLYKGKSSQLIERFLLQEGVPTIYNIDHKVSEVVIYQIENNLVGGFYRSHSGKTQRDNLNAQGMDFQKICPHSSKYGDCGVHHDVNMFDIYRILARIAGIAAHREILQLEAEHQTLNIKAQ
ncbi:MAG: glutamate--cysteine ligase [Candidatus Omnitrophica bacterium]|nr:glutamate--cysteine ligase [Candidatus Omnitrophota bacterium]